MKRTSWPVFLLSFLFAVIDPVVNKAQVRLYPILEDGKWGLMDVKGKTMVPAIYSSAVTVGSDLVEIGLPKGKGLIDREGKEVLPPRYAEILVQRDSMAWFREGNRWGYLHLPSGNLLPPIYDKPGGYFESKTVLEVTEEFSNAGNENPTKTLYTCISYDARILIPPIEHRITQCYDSGELVQLESKDHKLGYWNVSTGEYFDPTYSELKMLSDLRFAARREKNAPWKLIDMQGNLLFDYNFDKVRMHYNNWIQFSMGERKGLINEENKVLMEGNWERIQLIGQQAVAYMQNGYWGILSADGSVLLENSFNFLMDLGGDLVYVKMNSGSHDKIEGVISARGDTIIPIARHTIRPLSGGPGFAVLEEGSWAWYNDFGLPSEVRKCSNISDFKFGFAMLSQGDKVGMMDTRGTIVLPIEYDRITLKDGMAYALKGEKQQLFAFDDDGRLLTGNRFILVADAGGRGSRSNWRGPNQAGWFYYGRNGKYGLRNPATDSVVISPRYDRYQVIGNTGLTVTERIVNDYTRYGLVDYGRMRRVIEPVLRELHSEDFLQGNVARVTLQNGRRTFMSRRGKIMRSKRLRYVGRFSEGKSRIMFDGKIKWERGVGQNELESRSFRENGRMVEERLYAYGGKWTIVDGNGKPLCKPDYDFITDFKNGVALVMKKGKWGAIDSNMQTVIELEWDYLARLGNEPGAPLLAGKSDGSTGYVTIEGTTITGANNDGLGFENGHDFFEERAAIQRDGKWGFIDRNGRVQIGIEFDAAGDFHDGMAWVRKGRKIWFVDRQGTLIEVEKGIYRVGDFHDGLAWANANGRFGYLDKSGHWSIEPQYYEAGDFCHGLAIVREKSGRGMIDKRGNEVIKTHYERIFLFDNGMAIVRHKQRYGCIDSLGQMVVRPHFRKMGPFCEGLAQVKTGSWKGFVNQQGEVVIKGNYRQLGNFSGGMAAARVKDRWGYLNKQGDMVIAPKYIIAREFGGGPAAAYERGRWHLIDTLGKDLVHPMKDVSSLAAYSDGMTVARSEKSWVYLDSLGNSYGQLRGEKLQGLATFSNGIGQVQVNGGWKLVDRAMQPLMTINFKSPFSFKEGIGRVNFGMKYGMFAPDGTVLLEPRYDQVKKMGAIIQVGEGAELGYVLPDGNWVRR